MKIVFTKRFLRGFHALTIENQKRASHALELFRENPFHRFLRNHALRGKQRGVRSLTAGHDLRILYREENGSAIAILITVGTHDEVY